MKKKGISPVVATILLIAIVIILALIVFLWAKGFIQESIQKKGMSADQACDEINLQASYSSSSGDLEIINNGNIPMYGFEVNKEYSGGSETESFSNEPITSGKTFNKHIGEEYNRIEIFPKILGQGENSKKVYTCKNSFIAN